MASADPLPYFAASAVSAFVTFPFWKAATIGQSGYALTASSAFGRLLEVVRPPWRGSLVVVSGMTWARAAIFFGSDEGARWLRQRGWSAAVATALPPTLISAYVQVANQPFVRSSVMLQGDPRVSFAAGSRLPNLEVLKHLRRTKGTGAWFLGTGVGIFRTVPKYVAAIVAKDAMDRLLAPVEDATAAGSALRSAKKSVAAGVFGAVLTNPLDVIQNEMFKTEQGVTATCRRLCREESCRWLMRGIEKNVIASAVPIAITIFLTDAFANLRCGRGSA
mmetsp:Transcript_89002/g.288245  ORF Transcript_89002/g.288245 Transcript_89002/m.288245 type:complete len:277 (+) Transcript_89002:36-866(+)